MGFKMPPVPALIGIACAGLGLILQIVGVATTAWTVIEFTTHNRYIGLWKYCGKTGECVDIIGEDIDGFQACRAFGVIGVLLLAGCVVVGILMSFMANVHTKFSIIAAMCGFAAAGSILIEFAVYAGESLGGESNDGSAYGYSFYLTIVASVLAIAAGVCFLLGKGRE